MFESGFPATGNLQISSHIPRVLEEAAQLIDSVGSVAYYQKMRGFLTRTRYVSIFLLPALLVWIEGWGYMSGDYTGLHTFEWGYLGASIISVLAWLSMWTVVQKPGRLDHVDPELWDRLVSVALYSLTAFAIATNAWWREERALVIAFWVGALSLVILTVVDLLNYNRGKPGHRPAGRLAVLIGFLALLFWMLRETASEFSHAAFANERTIDIASLFSQSQRDLFSSARGPFALLALASIGTANILSLLGQLNGTFRYLRSLHFASVVYLLLIPLFPMTHWILAFFPYKSEFWEPIGYSDTRTLFYFMLSGVALVLILAPRVRGMLGSDNGSNSTLASFALLTSAAYSFAPITSSVMGNIEYTAFWFFLLGSFLTTLIYLTLTSLRAKPPSASSLPIQLSMLALVLAGFSFVMWEFGLYPDEEPSVAVLTEIRILMRPEHRDVFIFATGTMGASMLMSSWMAVRAYLSRE